MIRPEEAILILTGWRDSKTDLLLSASMINFRLTSKCRVIAVDGGRATLWPVNDGAAAFTFSVDSPHLKLKYSELREFKGKPGLEEVSEDDLSKSALIVTLPLRELDASAPFQMDIEQIFLTEV